MSTFTLPLLRLFCLSLYSFAIFCTSPSSQILLFFPFISRTLLFVFSSPRNPFLWSSPYHPPASTSPSLVLPAPNALPSSSQRLRDLPSRAALRSPHDLYAGSNPVTTTLLASACLLRLKWRVQSWYVEEVWRDGNWETAEEEEDTIKKGSREERGRRLVREEGLKGLWR